MCRGLCDTKTFFCGFPKERVKKHVYVDLVFRGRKCKPCRSHCVREMMAHLYAMGLANPSEKTLGLVSAVLGFKRFQSMQPELMQSWLDFHLAMKQQVQGTLDRLKKTTQQGPPLVLLPGTVAEFGASSVFATEQPVSPKVNMDQLLQMIVIYPLRKAKNFAHQTNASGNTRDMAMANPMMNPLSWNMQLGLDWLYRERYNANVPQEQQRQQQSLPGLQVFGVPGNHVTGSRPSGLPALPPPDQQIAQPHPVPAAQGSAQLALQDGRPEESCKEPAKAVQMGGGTAPASKPPQNDSIPETKIESEKPKAVSPAKTGATAGLAAMATLSNALLKREKDKADQKANSGEAVMKKPAAKSSNPKAKAKAAMKKPSCAVKATKSKIKSMKCEKSAGEKMMTQQLRFKMKPEGCSKCRYRRGCTDSCWVQRGWTIVKK